MSIEHKIERLIEEASQNVQQAVSQVRGGDIASPVTAVLPINVGAMHAGYKAGSEMGHPIAGTFLGQEGAAGARSGWDPSVGIGDVYTKGNMLKRGLQGTALGGILGGLTGDPETAALLAATGGAASTALTPGLGYGLGKVFGSNMPSKDRKF